MNRVVLKILKPQCRNRAYSALCRGFDPIGKRKVFIGWDKFPPIVWPEICSIFFELVIYFFTWFYSWVLGYWAWGMKLWVDLALQMPLESSLEQRRYMNSGRGKPSTNTIIDIDWSKDRGVNLRPIRLFLYPTPPSIENPQHLKIGASDLTMAI